MQVISSNNKRPIKSWAGIKDDGSHNIEHEALAQLYNVASLPFIHTQGIAVMPDVHGGIGATVGCVIPTSKAIIPAAVGVDIGCGMNAIRLSLKASDLPDSLSEIRHAIERGVPVGMNQHNDAKQTRLVESPTYKAIINKHFKRDQKTATKAQKQIGTLGGGNHFIELCIDENQDVWIMLHSGSRGIGNMIGRHFIEKAKLNMQKLFIHLPDTDLSYFAEDTEDFNDYVEAVQWAQDYAFENRAVMMQEVLRNLKLLIKKPFQVTREAINCHHNYVEKENHFGQNVWLTRKGAIRAREGDLGIIPGSMGTKSFIVRGKGNPDSYCSCSHGAGRIMSRTQAKKQFSLEDLQEQTAGVECRKDAGVIDEIPSSYKNIDEVMDLQSDLVEVLHTLKQVMCIKG